MTCGNPRYEIAATETFQTADARVLTLIVLHASLHHLTSIFLTLLIFLAGGNFAVAKNQQFSASLGNLCAVAVDQEFSATECSEDTGKGRLDRRQ